MFQKEIITDNGDIWPSIPPLHLQNQHTPIQPPLFPKSSTFLSGHLAVVGLLWMDLLLWNM